MSSKVCMCTCIWAYAGCKVNEQEDVSSQTHTAALHSRIIYYNWDEYERWDREDVWVREQVGILHAKTHIQTNKYQRYPHRVSVRVHMHAQTVWLAVTPTHREAMAQLTSLL